MAGEAAARPDVLAYPSPTTSRFLVFLATLIAAGAFIGNWLHTEVRSDAWLAQLAACSTVAPPGTTLEDALEQTSAQQRCSASGRSNHATIVCITAKAFATSARAPH